MENKEGKNNEQEVLDENIDIVTEENTEQVLDKDEIISKLNTDLEEQAKKSEEYLDHLKRNMAEFDNYKKRMAKEKENMYISIVADFIAEILPIMDNFEKAINAESTDESFKDGIHMIYDQLKEMLDKTGLEEIECQGQDFDPNLHEAVMHVEDENYAEKQVVEVFRKGYRLGDKIIRHAMVKVAN